MSYNPNIHHRRSIRLKGYDYSQVGLYFITICVQNKENLFGRIADGEMLLNEYGKIIDDEWNYLKIKYPTIEIHEYVIMPNHFHCIVEIASIPVGAGFARPNNDTANPELGSANPANSNLGSANPANSNLGLANPVNSKLGRANPAPTLGNIIGYFKYQTTKKIALPFQLWQRNYYEHIIRTERSHQNISDYIIHNPANWKDDRFYLPSN
jgi:REP element-mobilizing transposase RayT